MLDWLVKNNYKWFILFQYSVYYAYFILFFISSVSLIVTAQWLATYQYLFHDKFWITQVRKILFFSLSLALSLTKGISYSTNSASML